jgi:uracil-DNA glycosylase
MNFPIHFVMYTSKMTLMAETHNQKSWQSALQGEREKAYFKELLTFIEERRGSGCKVFPQNNEVFLSLQLTAFEDVKVVILGQDPYHGAGQAHGLAFSVLPGVPSPPSLQNIYKELRSDIGFTIPKTGYLAPWASRGVLLLNSVLTVEEGKPGSHANKGWEQFTDRVISEVATQRENVVFLLWGSYAQKKAASVDSSKHLVLHAPHPSPLSAHRGFLGCKHFSQANAYLQKHGIQEVDWQIE